MANNAINKKVQFEERIMVILNTALRTKMSDTTLKLATITRVDLTPDYSIAKVYWDTFDSTKRGDLKAAFASVLAKLRTVLASEMKVRHTPVLEFHYDSSYESEGLIDSILSGEKSEGRYNPPEE